MSTRETVKMKTYWNSLSFTICLLDHFMSSLWLLRKMKSRAWDPNDPGSFVFSGFPKVALLIVTYILQE